MNNEFIIWGIPPVDNCLYCETHDDAHENHETVIYTSAKTLAEANKVLEILVTDHGITKAFIQEIDFRDDLAKTWQEVVN